MDYLNNNLANLLAACWFIACWAGYTRYASWKARDTACLASVLHLYRHDWMRRMLLRENRIADAKLETPMHEAARHGVAARRRSKAARRIAPRLSLRTSSAAPQRAAIASKIAKTAPA